MCPETFAEDGLELSQPGDVVIESFLWPGNDLPSSALMVSDWCWMGPLNPVLQA